MPAVCYRLAPECRSRSLGPTLFSIPAAHLHQPVAAYPLQHHKITSIRVLLITKPARGYRKLKQIWLKHSCFCLEAYKVRHEFVHRVVSKDHRYIHLDAMPTRRDGLGDSDVLQIQFKMQLVGCISFSLAILEFYTVLQPKANNKSGPTFSSSTPEAFVDSESVHGSARASGKSNIYIHDSFLSVQSVQSSSSRGIV